MSVITVHEDREVAICDRDFHVNIEGNVYPWDRHTITVLEIRLIGRLPEGQPVIEINLHDNTERTLTECEVVEIKPGYAFAKKVRYQRG